MSRLAGSFPAGRKTVFIVVVLGALGLVVGTAPAAKKSGIEGVVRAATCVV